MHDHTDSVHCHHREPQDGNATDGTSRPITATQASSVGQCEVRSLTQHVLPDRLTILTGRRCHPRIRQSPDPARDQRLPVSLRRPIADHRRSHHVRQKRLKSFVILLDHAHTVDP